MNAPVAEKEKQQTAVPQVRRICFVCTGNTCRSPMAAAVANAIAEKQNIRTEAFSAGISAFEGDPIAANAVTALEKAEIPAVPGHDYHKHSAHNLCAEEAERYDMLIGMTQGHVMALVMQFPHLATRIRVMPQEITDPYGGDEERYRVCLKQITEGVEAILKAGKAE